MTTTPEGLRIVAPVVVERWSKVEPVDDEFSVTSSVRIEHQLGVAMVCHEILTRLLFEAGYMPDRLDPERSAESLLASMQEFIRANGLVPPGPTE